MVTAYCPCGAEDDGDPTTTTCLQCSAARGDVTCEPDGLPPETAEPCAPVCGDLGVMGDVRCNALAVESCVDGGARLACPDGQRCQKQSLGVYCIACDPEEPPRWYRDADCDGQGALDFVFDGCDPPLGFVETSGDPDDHRFRPIAVESLYTREFNRCQRLTGNDFDNLTRLTPRQLPARSGQRGPA
ncbi:MAG: hypothetical protein ACI9MR_002552 [Myxococcota bacterium]